VVFVVSHSLLQDVLLYGGLGHHILVFLLLVVRVPQLLVYQVQQRNVEVCVTPTRAVRLIVVDGDLFDQIWI
jgi:hypothetical protein